MAPSCLSLFNVRTSNKIKRPFKEGSWFLLQLKLNYSRCCFSNVFDWHVFTFAWSKQTSSCFHSWFIQEMKSKLSFLLSLGGKWSGFFFWHVAKTKVIITWCDLLSCHQFKITLAKEGQVLKAMYRKSYTQGHIVSKYEQKISCV